ncbi:MAG: winged helix-turn-helix domain-containing protein [Pyrobaculum sp.]
MSEHVFEALSHPVRRKILQLLAERPRLYSELMEEIGVDSPTLAFHLKKLAGLVEKNEKGFYQLTEAGERAVKIIKEVEGVRPAEPAAPRAEDILLHDRVLLKIDNALLELAKREGRRIRIQDVAIVEVEKRRGSKAFLRGGGGD